MASNKPTIKKVMRRTLDRDYPKYDKTFAESAWEAFDFDAVVEVLLSKEWSFPYHKTILLSALGAWVVAPDRPPERRSAIISNVRLALAQVEKRILAAPPDQRFRKDIAWRIAGMGPRFMQDIYYPIGGIRTLVEERADTDVRQHLRHTFESRISSFAKLLQIIHHETQQVRDAKKFRPVSLTRTYQSIKAINTHMQQNGILGEKPRFLEQKSYEAQISACGFPLVLMYAASLVEIADDKTLLDRFLNPYVRCSTTTRRAALERWLGISAYLFSEVISKLGSRSLMPDRAYKVLQVEPVSVPAPPLESWEADIVTSKMKTSHQSQPRLK
jgi:hypothetical protein